MELFLVNGELASEIIYPNEKCGAKPGNHDWAGIRCSYKSVVPVLSHDFTLLSCYFGGASVFKYSKAMYIHEVPFRRLSSWGRSSIAVGKPSCIRSFGIEAEASRR